MTDLNKLEAIRREAMERAVIDSIPKELRENMEKAQAKFESKGGCKGCGSKLIGVHYPPCPETEGDFY